MKKILLLALLAIGMSARGQITLEHVYDTASTRCIGIPNQLMIINFAVSGERYVNINRWAKKINIYSMNHSLVKSISYDTFPQSTNFPLILYISEKLFSTDNKISFMYWYMQCDSVSSSAFLRIYNEDGVLLFKADSLTPLESSGTAMPNNSIYNTTYGTKMILEYYCYSSKTKVYSLPGTLSASVAEANINLLAQSKISNPYPNPTNNTTNIDYTLPPGINEGEIVFYNLQGAEVKRFKVDKTFSTLLVSTTDIAAGTYLYQLQTSVQSSEGKKMVVIK